MPTLAEFLEANPWCCFCGGETPAEQRDHVPPKAMFAAKGWPEDYEFPACGTCNQGSKQLDQALALIARTSILNRKAGRNEVRKYIRGVANNAPEFMPQPVRSSIEAKKLFRELGITKPDGMLSIDVPIVTIDAEALASLNPLLRKLFCALYYKHVGRIVPRDGRIMCIRTTNQILSYENPFGWQRHPMFRNEPVIQRAGRSLTDQFDYLWGEVDDRTAFGFSFHLGGSIFGVMGGPFTLDLAANAPPASII